MKETKQLKIDAQVDLELQQASRHCSLSKKNFAEEAILFFASRQLNPKGYQPGSEFDQLQLIQRNTERIIGFVQQQEQESLTVLLSEILRSQVAMQALINLVVDYAVEPKRQEAVAQRIETYIREQMEQLILAEKKLE